MLLAIFLPHQAIKLLLLCLLVGITQIASSQQIIKPENKDISLEGTIRLVRSFGPPGYGENPKHDAHVSYWALEVPISVNVPCTAMKPEDVKYECASAKRLNLFFEGDGFRRLSDRLPAKWINQQVVVRGKLHRADTAGEMTPIYMDAVLIQGRASVSTGKH